MRIPNKNNVFGEPSIDHCMMNVMIRSKERSIHSLFLYDNQDEKQKSAISHVVIVNKNRNIICKRDRESNAK